MTTKSSCGNCIARLRCHAPRAQRETGDGYLSNTHKEIGTMKALVARFVREESGQDLIEYGLLVGVVTAVSAATVTAIGTKVKTWFDALKTAIGA